MQYLNTNATDFNALLIEIRDFLSANGWTTLADGTGGGGLTLEMTNGNSHDFKFTRRTIVQNIYVEGSGLTTFNDDVLQIAYQKSDIGLAAGYTATPCETNDCNGPFSNVWLVTDDDASYCVCVLQTGSSRYSHFAFGDLNNRDLHAINVPFALGLYYNYWRTGINYDSASPDFTPMNDLRATHHNIGMFTYRETSEGHLSRGAQVGLPDALVNPALGFTDGPIEKARLRANSSLYLPDTVGGNQQGAFLDFLRLYDNQGYTGGVPIFPISTVVVNVANNAQSYIGEFPGIGQVNMAGLVPGQVLDFAGEEWIVFPLKQYGTPEHANGGVAALPITNTVNYGIAVKKTDAP